MKKLPLLGDITPAQFLRDYWHKKPLLIRQAIPGFTPLLTVDALAELATKNYVESRLITKVDGNWDMQHGPLAALPARDDKEWTMPVQGVNRSTPAPTPCCASSALSRTRAWTT